MRALKKIAVYGVGIQRRTDGYQPVQLGSVAGFRTVQCDIRIILQNVCPFLCSLICIFTNLLAAR
jgi:hypothetical protein